MPLLGRSGTTADGPPVAAEAGGTGAGPRAETGPGDGSPTGTGSGVSSDGVKGGACCAASGMLSGGASANEVWESGA